MSECIHGKRFMHRNGYLQPAACCRCTIAHFEQQLAAAEAELKQERRRADEWVKIADGIDGRHAVMVDQRDAAREALRVALGTINNELEPQAAQFRLIRDYLVNSDWAGRDDEVAKSVIAMLEVSR